MEVNGQLHTLAAVPLGAHWIRDRVNPTASLEVVKNEKILSLSMPGI
jgi:hypothetical protein